MRISSSFIDNGSELIRKIALAASILAIGVVGVTLAVWLAVADDCGTQGCSPATDLAFDTEDMAFILRQIKIAERHAAGENLLDILPNATIPWGLRTVDGSFNNVIPGREENGQAD